MSAELSELVQRVAPRTLAREQVLPVAEELRGLFPGGGLPRGSMLIVGADPAGGSRTLALALVAEATQQGAWVAVVGLAGIGLAAAADLGVALERVAVIDKPDAKQWTSVVAALIGACDLVLTDPPARIRPAELRRLQSRARERGSVLLSVGPSSRQQALQGQADVSFTVRERFWEGLGVGHGHLQACRAVLEVSGRRQAARHRELDLWLPGADGRVQVCEPIAAEREPARYAGADLDVGILDVGILDVGMDVPPDPERVASVVPLPTRHAG